MDEREAYAAELERRYRGKKTRPVRLIENGRVFQSASALADYLAVSPTTIHAWLKTGEKAEYAGEAQ